MNPSKIIEQLHRRPFRPFRVCLSDGSSYEVRHPELALVTRMDVVIALDPGNGDMPERSVICDPLHITRLEPVGQRKTRGARSGRKA